MKSRQQVWVAFCGVALGAAGFGVWQLHTAAEMEETRAAALGQTREARTRIAELEKKLVAETKRAEAVESDNAALASAVEKAQAARAKPVAAPAPVLTSPSSAVGKTHSLSF